MKKVYEVRIRNIDAGALARIDQLVENSTFKSRNAYLKHYIETLSVLQELKDQENRYNALIENLIQTLAIQTAAIESLKLKIERLENKYDETK